MSKNEVFLKKSTKMASIANEQYGAITTSQLADNCFLQVRVNASRNVLVYMKP
jgi:hypothetical protein